MRNVFNYFSKKYSKRVIEATKLSKKIFYVSKEDKLFFEKNNSQTQYLPDVALNDLINDEGKDIFSRDLKAIWVGRIDELKALNILVEAINRSEILKNYLTVTVVGDGAERENIEQKIKEYKLQDNFIFLERLAMKKWDHTLKPMIF